MTTSTPIAVNPTKNQRYIGKTIRIIEMNDQYGDVYAGRTGKVEWVDDMGNLHGTWGGLAVIPEIDTIEVLN